ncbi:rhomboid family intramembrane serine protease [Anaeromyxobacter oryzisoli]|uniref:rhomboid family intramembrane serine protease n=1 Tax=Anaeromyxobacter oryzisoli TaxID=2925408 RepID=UPI001F578882|nr:rhomboid family intramembrane serine protease [Anaeromyxobacter sp. SG63]
MEPHFPAAPSPPPHAVRPTPVSWAILAANLAMFGWVESHGSSTDTATLIRFGALERDLVWSGQWWRLLSAAFLHAGLFHLAANMVFGIPWCRQIERFFGSARFASLYVLGALGASALSLLGPASVSVGASGALFGVIGAALALHRRALGSWRAFIANRGSQQVLLNLLILAVIGTVVPIDQFAHAGGLATGAAWGWIATRPSPRRSWPWVALTAAVAVAVALALRPRP